MPGDVPDALPLPAEPPPGHPANINVGPVVIVVFPTPLAATVLGSPGTFKLIPIDVLHEITLRVI